MLQKGKETRLNNLFGPGTVSMVICVVLIAAWNLLQPAKIKIERHVETSGEKLNRKPNVRHLLTWKSAMKLSPGQIEQLQKLNNEQEKSLAPVNEEIDRIDLKQINDIAARLKAPSKQKRSIETSISQRACL